MELQDWLNEKDLKRCMDFHGHLCPGLATGFVASREGLKRLEESRAADEEVVSIVLTDACCADAVQVLTGSTFGKGNFFYKDYGKVVMTFISRQSEKAFRFSLKPGAVSLSEHHRFLLGKVTHEAASEQEREEFWGLHREKSVEILNTPAEELFNISQVSVEMPETAEILPSVPCSRCGEPVMATRLETLNGEKICLECLEAPSPGQ